MVEVIIHSKEDLRQLIMKVYLQGANNALAGRKVTAQEYASNVIGCMDFELVD